ncbi:hypothetical protein NDU88_007037 [Pleurodeles waltl]|uniref:Uncharacterized protein n=1 Tax=Pleurodeles waltl TaxID=8319 RepID=A0AAV7WHC9_PLEWA|nr:hypothetical protein NDU88_007037 [Pleurodeles waltl]
MLHLIPQLCWPRTHTCSEGPRQSSSDVSLSRVNPDRDPEHQPTPRKMKSLLQKRNDFLRILEEICHRGLELIGMVTVVYKRDLIIGKGLLGRPGHILFRAVNGSAKLRSLHKSLCLRISQRGETELHGKLK